MDKLCRGILISFLTLQITGCLEPAKTSEEVNAMGSFTKLASMSYPRADHVSEAVNGKIYVIGGVTASGPINLSSVEEYDPGTDTWSNKASMSFSRQGMGSATYNNKIYVFGGYDGPEVARVEVYDPSNDTWTTLNNMPSAAGYVSAATVGTKIYVSLRAIGGSGQIANMYEYDPSNDSWLALSTYAPYSTNGSHIAAVGTDIYFVGRDSALIYDTVNDVWSKVDGAWGNTGNGGKSTAVLNNMIYLFDESNWTTGLQVYKLVGGLAGAGFYSPVMVSIGATATLNGSAYFSGGAAYDSSISSDFYRFDF